MAMTDRTIELDHHRGMAAQKATEIRREIAEVRANTDALRARQAELEMNLLAAPSSTWQEAGEKASYLLTIFAAVTDAHDTRRQKLISNVLEDFARLSRESAEGLHPGE